MRISAIDAVQTATGTNPIRWPGWLIGAAISALFWLAIYWAWTSL